ncbi:hypothetical protein D3C76_1490460 [compost metagenome]
MQIQILSEPYENYSFSVLRNKMFSIDYFGVIWAIYIKIRNPITQFSQSLLDDSEGVALIMTFKVLDVF